MAETSLTLPRVARYITGLLALLLASACVAEPASDDNAAFGADPGDATMTMTLDSMIPGLRQPRTNLLIGGQPSSAAWPALGAAGVRTVINLRPDSELGGRDESAEVAAAGLIYRQIPVAGSDDITMANALALWKLIDQAEGKVAVHCASGNRVGALLALGAAQHGMDIEAAVAFGKSAGLGNAETRVREVLAAQADPAPPEVSAPAPR